MNTIIIEPLGQIENYAISPYSVDGYYDATGVIEQYRINVFSADGSGSSGYVFGVSQSDKDLLAKWTEIYNRLISNAPKIGETRGGSGVNLSERQAAYAKADKELKDEENRLIALVNKAKKDYLPFSAWNQQLIESRKKIQEANNANVGKEKKVNKAINEYNDLLNRIKAAEISGKKKVYEHEARLYALRTSVLKRDGVDVPKIFEGSAYNTVAATNPIKEEPTDNNSERTAPTNEAGSKLKPILIGVLVLGTLTVVGRLIYKSIKNK